jgi:alcohol dehydrogenase class IV
MRFNLPACRKQLARIAQLLGEDVSGADEDEAAEGGIAAVERLQRQGGAPERLRDLGVTAEQIPQVAEKAFQAKRILRVNPRPTTVEDLQQILRAAL